MTEKEGVDRFPGDPKGKLENTKRLSTEKVTDASKSAAPSKSSKFVTPGKSSTATQSGAPSKSVTPSKSTTQTDNDAKVQRDEIKYGFNLPWSQQPGLKYATMRSEFKDSDLNVASTKEASLPSQNKMLKSSDSVGNKKEKSQFHWASRDPMENTSVSVAEIPSEVPKKRSDEHPPGDDRRDSTDSAAMDEDLEAQFSHIILAAKNSLFPLTPKTGNFCNLTSNPVSHPLHKKTTEYIIKQNSFGFVRKSDKREVPKKRSDEHPPGDDRRDSTDSAAMDEDLEAQFSHIILAAKNSLFPLTPKTGNFCNLTSNPVSHPLHKKTTEYIIKQNSFGFVRKSDKRSVWVESENPPVSAMEEGEEEPFVVTGSKSSLLKNKEVGDKVSSKLVKGETSVDKTANIQFREKNDKKKVPRTKGTEKLAVKRSLEINAKQDEKNNSAVAKHSNRLIVTPSVAALASRDSNAKSLKKITPKKKSGVVLNHDDVEKRVQDLLSEKPRKTKRQGLKTLSSSSKKRSTSSESTNSSVVAEPKKVATPKQLIPSVDVLAPKAKKVGSSNRKMKLGERREELRAKLTKREQFAAAIWHNYFCSCENTCRKRTNSVSSLSSFSSPSGASSSEGSSRSLLSRMFGLKTGRTIHRSAQTFGEPPPILEASDVAAASKYPEEKSATWRTGATKERKVDDVKKGRVVESKEEKKKRRTQYLNKLLRNEDHEKATSDENEFCEVSKENGKVSTKGKQRIILEERKDLANKGDRRSLMETKKKVSKEKQKKPARDDEVRKVFKQKGKWNLSKELEETTASKEEKRKVSGERENMKNSEIENQKASRESKSLKETGKTGAEQRTIKKSYEAGKGKKPDDVKQEAVSEDIEGKANLKFLERRRPSKEVPTEIPRPSKEVSTEIPRPSKEVSTERRRPSTELRTERRRPSTELRTEKRRSSKEVPTERRRSSKEVPTERRRSSKEVRTERRRPSTELQTERRRPSKEVLTEMETFSATKTGSSIRVHVKSTVIFKNDLPSRFKETKMRNTEGERPGTRKKEKSDNEKARSFKEQKNVKEKLPMVMGRDKKKGRRISPTALAEPKTVSRKDENEGQTNLKQKELLGKTKEGPDGENENAKGDRDSPADSIGWENRRTPLDLGKGSKPNRKQKVQTPRSDEGQKRLTMKTSRSRSLDEGGRYSWKTEGPLTQKNPHDFTQLLPPMEDNDEKYIKNLAALRDPQLPAIGLTDTTVAKCLDFVLTRAIEGQMLVPECLKTIPKSRSPHIPLRVAPGPPLPRYCINSEPYQTAGVSRSLPTEEEIQEILKRKLMLPRGRWMKKCPVSGTQEAYPSGGGCLSLQYLHSRCNPSKSFVRARKIRTDIIPQESCCSCSAELSAPPPPVPKTNEVPETPPDSPVKKLTATRDSVNVILSPRHVVKESRADSVSGLAGSTSPSPKLSLDSLTLNGKILSVAAKLQTRSSTPLLSWGEVDRPSCSSGGGRRRQELQLVHLSSSVSISSMDTRIETGNIHYNCNIWSPPTPAPPIARTWSRSASSSLVIIHTTDRLCNDSIKK
ncbi:unnamed protein product [Cyprideis torosa]|uniref:Uncharacterized protein n=1 Tax=Cyprideis torosa TaxID=163714 RepID=A0A7R8WKM1_9CRUS|nr:unnamed protein product [Cyprideis torosa]CAG0903337.1 unnamed protein product [Cyprideis torosa]